MLVMVWGGVIPNMGTYWVDLLNNYSQNVILIAQEWYREIIDNKKIVDFYPLPYEKEVEFLKNYNNPYDAQIDWTYNEQKYYEELFLKYIKDIEQKYEKIVILSVKALPVSLKNICKKKSIPYGILENSCINSGPAFDIKSGTLLLECDDILKGRIECFDRYNRMLSENNEGQFFLSQRKILELLLTSKMAYLAFKNVNPKYEFGIAKPYPNGHPDDFVGWDSYKLNDYVIKKHNLSSEEKRKTVCVRPRPGAVDIDEELALGFSIDTSKSALEFVMNCESIYGVSVGTAFTALIAKREAYFVFEERYTGDNDIAPINVNDDRFINFFVFAYFIPWEFIFNEEYLWWRLGKPNEYEVLLKSRDFLIRKYTFFIGNKHKFNMLALRKLVKKIINRLKTS